MPHNDDSRTRGSDKDPVEPTESSLLNWVKLILTLLVASVAMIATAVTSAGTRPPFIDASQFDDPLGVRAATFAICAAAMLSFTMIEAGDSPGAKAVDLLIRIGSLIFAFLSGWSWLESALGEFSLPYYVLTIGSLALLVVVGILFGPAAILIYQFRRDLLSRIRR